MLQIYISGPLESGFLDIDPGTVLSMESVADIFDEDLSTGEFSLPGKAPWTGNNKKLLGFAERFQNLVTPVRDFKCAVFDSGYPELPAGKFSIIGKTGNFSYTKGSFDFTITGTKGLFGSQIKNKKVNDLQLGGKITWADIDSRHFAEAFMKGSYQQYNYLAFVPVAIENFFNTGRPDYDGEFLAKDTVNTVVVSGAGPDGWTFGRPKSDIPSEAAVEGTPEYADYRTVPFLKTKYVLRKIFEENGYKVTGEFLESPDFNDLATFNNYAIENYSPGHIDYNRSIYPANHVPKMLIIDYLKGLLAAFNMYLIFTGDNEVRLVIRRNLKKQKKILSLQNIASELFSSTNDNKDNGNGYTLSYDWGNDDYPGDRVKDLKDKTLVATVGIRAELDTIDAGRVLTTDDIAYVEAENLYYQVADATSSPVKWDCYSEGLEEFITGTGDRKVDMPISTLCTYVEFNVPAALFLKKDYVGARMQGSYLNNKGVRVTGEFGNKIFFARRITNSSNVEVPSSYNHNRDAANKIINPFSLAWRSATGMAAQFHEEWQAIKENLETVKSNLAANRKIVSDLAQNDYVEVNNVLFLISKTERTIPLQSGVDVEMVVA